MCHENWFLFYHVGLGAGPSGLGAGAFYPLSHLLYPVSRFKHPRLALLTVTELWTRLREVKHAMAWMCGFGTELNEPPR